MKKSEMATRIRELENNFVELCALHNHAERLLREWVERVSDIEKYVKYHANWDCPTSTQTDLTRGTITSDGNSKRQESVNAYLREWREQQEDMRKHLCSEAEKEPYRAPTSYSLSQQSADVQQQIRDMLVDE